MTSFNLAFTAREGVTHSLLKQTLADRVSWHWYLKVDNGRILPQDMDTKGMMRSLRDEKVHRGTEGMMYREG